MDGWQDTFPNSTGRKFPIWKDVDTALSALRSAYSDGTRGHGWVFRGQVDAHWDLTPKLYRALSGEDELKTRRTYTARFLAALEERSQVQMEPCVGPTGRSEDERLAIAQHYGFPTRLLDFTCSSRVAAFFATYGTPIDANVGVIYCLHQSEWSSFENAFQCWRMSRAESESLLAKHEMRLAPPISLVEPKDVRRIQIQEGIFIAVDEPRFDIRELLIDCFHFFHERGRVYQKAPVTELQLFPLDDPLAEFAADWRNANPY
jgi:hypothetical protein